MKKVKWTGLILGLMIVALSINLGFPEVKKIFTPDPHTRGYSNPFQNISALIFVLLVGIFFIFKALKGKTVTQTLKTDISRYYINPYTGKPTTTLPSVKNLLIWGPIIAVSIILIIKIDIVLDWFNCTFMHACQQNARRSNTSNEYDTKKFNIPVNINTYPDGIIKP